MKKYIFYEVARHASRNLSYYQKQRWKRRLKYFAIFAVVSTLTLGGLAIWGTVVVANKVASSFSEETIQENVAKGQESLKALASQPITTKNCLDTVGSMLSPTKLLTVPVAQNLASVRGACWDKRIEPQDGQKKS